MATSAALGTEVAVVAMRPWARRFLISTLTFSVAASLGSVPAEAVGWRDAASSPAATGPPAPADADPFAVAKSTGKRVEVERLRTETTQVFANPSGTSTMESYAMPVRTRRGAEWVDIDTTLRLQPDGSVRPEATVADVRLSGGGRAPLVTLAQPGTELQLGWSGTLPAPTLAGDTATYPEVLPGVNLKVKVSRVGFSQVLVVKNREAARNPALRRLRYPIATTGLTLRTTADGTTVASDSTGAPVFVAGKPTMWDTPATPTTASARAAAERAGEPPAPHYAQFPAALADGAMVIEPDQTMLNAADTRYPVSIDPDFSGPQYRWTHVASAWPDQSYWSLDRVQAKVGYQGWSSPYSKHRSYFQMGTSTINGSKVRNAYFAITLDHSALCGANSTADLYQTDPIDPAVAVTWTNSVNEYWPTTSTGSFDTSKKLASASGHANEQACAEPDMGMEFAGANLKSLVQSIADSRAGFITLGLRAPDSSEGNRNNWMKFHPNTATIVVEYNNVPPAPTKLNATRAIPCGTATAPTPISTTQPQFSAVGYDADGNNLTNELQIYRSDGVLAHSVTTTSTTSGAAFSWPAVPTGKLAHGSTYYYRARSNDGLDWGPFTGNCYFVVDTVAPQLPSISSTDYPNGQPVIPARTTGTVTLRANNADTDVTEFIYGFQQDALTMRVRAAADDTATIPITVWPDPVTGVPSKRLYVKSADAAGNVSPTTPAWDMTTLPNPAPIPHVRNDTNGDGRSDVTTVLDHGFGRTAAWNVIARDGGFHTGAVAWDSGQNGGFPADRIRAVPGDFTGDGRTDLAVFQEEPERKISLYLLESDGNRYEVASTPVWAGGPAIWSLTMARIATGDVNADGKSDIAVQIDEGNSKWRVSMFLGGNLGAPVLWLQGPAGSPAWVHQAPLLADIDGDDRADLVSMRNAGGCRTTTVMYRSTGTAFTSTAVTLHDSGAGTYCWERSKPVVGDVNGDGRDDIITMYDHSATDSALWAFQSTGTALTAAQWWRTPNEFDAIKATLSTGDFNTDGRDDVAIVHAGAGGSRQVWTLASTGTAFAARSLGWQEQVGAVGGPRSEVEHRSYELIARHSRRCLEVPGNSTADNQVLDQYDCVAGALNERFRLVPVPGTERFVVKAVHSVKCAAVQSASVAEAAIITQTPCDDLTHQQVTVEYVDGSTSDTVVHLRFAHSGKCGDIATGSGANGADFVQQTCDGTGSQQWILRPAYNTRQLGGLYRITSEVGGKVLDVAGCATKDGSDVQVWDWISTSKCQRWTLQSLGDDVYQIIDGNTGKALDILGCSTADGAVATIWTSNSSICQRWRIEPAAGGAYTVFAANTGKTLDVKSCSAAAGADLILWPYRGASCQRYLIAPENMAFARPVTVSSTETTSFPGSYAVDGSGTTRWSSARSDPQWIQIDLGSTKQISRVKLIWESAYASSYTIATSNDGVTWTTIYSTTAGNGATDDLTGLTGSGRYVRANLTVRGTTYGYSLWEFEVYAPA